MPSVVGLASVCQQSARSHFRAAVQSGAGLLPLLFLQLRGTRCAQNQVHHGCIFSPWRAPQRRDRGCIPKRARSTRDASSVARSSARSPPRPQPLRRYSPPNLRSPCRPVIPTSVDTGYAIHKPNLILAFCLFSLPKVLDRIFESRPSAACGPDLYRGAVIAVDHKGQSAISTPRDP